MTSLNNQTTKRFYFDTPQTDKLQAFTINNVTGMLTSATFTNTHRKFCILFSAKRLDKR